MKTNLKSKLLLSLILAGSFLAGSSPVLAENHEHHHHQHETTLSTPSTDSVFNITDNWTAADGKTLVLAVGACAGATPVFRMLVPSGR